MAHYGQKSEFADVPRTITNFTAMRERRIIRGRIQREERKERRRRERRRREGKRKSHNHLRIRTFTRLHLGLQAPRPGPTTPFIGQNSVFMVLLLRTDQEIWRWKYRLL
jgi:hypothetical protein